MTSVDSVFSVLNIFKRNYSGFKFIIDFHMEQGNISFNIKSTKSCACLVAAFFLLLAPGPASGQNLRTDSRAPYVHRITIYDKNGERIDHTDEFYAVPYSPKVTCGKCHNIDEISLGWHFDANNPDVNAGRKGEPWIWLDPDTRTQLPLSYRNWPGAYRPEQVGITEWQFVRYFGRHMTGGVPLTAETEVDPFTERPDRRHISGELEIDCMICHSADPSYDPEEWARQIEKENFTWAPSAATGLASILGTTKDLPDDFDPEFPEFSDPFAELPQTKYNQTKFEAGGRVFFDIPGIPPDERCYFCHTTHNVDLAQMPRFQQDIDVHLRAGMSCTDCHRHGLDHMVTRSYDGEKRHSSNMAAETLTCRACHIGRQEADKPIEFGGRLGAPIAEHKGMPPVHFDRLSCTACHSGPWPAQRAVRIQTALAHGLGLAEEDRSHLDPPLIQEPVFVEQSNGVIAPHRLVWPSFWGKMKDDQVAPLPVEKISRSVSRILKVRKEEASNKSQIWQPIADEQITAALEKIQTSLGEGETAVYVTGGKVHKLEDTTVVWFLHDAAEPYTWPLAHDVRPGGQSLGVRNCVDCHATDAPFYFGEVKVASLLATDEDSIKMMTEFNHLGSTYPKIFARSFWLRSPLKAVTLACGIVIASVLILYGFKALARILKAAGTEDV
jgi:hypothetical protein